MNKIELTDEEKEIKANRYFKLLKEHAIGKKVIVHRYYAGFDTREAGILKSIKDYKGIVIEKKSGEDDLDFISTWGAIVSITDYANENKVYYNYENQIPRTYGSGYPEVYNMFLERIYGKNIANQYKLPEREKTLKRK